LRWKEVAWFELSTLRKFNKTFMHFSHLFQTCWQEIIQQGGMEKPFLDFDPSKSTRVGENRIRPKIRIKLYLRM